MADEKQINTGGAAFPFEGGENRGLHPDAEKHALLIADKVEPDFRGKGKSCSSWSAKKWQAAYDAVIECFSSVILQLPVDYEIKQLEWVKTHSCNGILSACAVALV